MGYGYKEIYDLSPLSIKNLNDQLYRLWKKVMGGITEADILEGEAQSIVASGLSGIDIGIETTSGTNLVHNGRGNFGTEAFQVSEKSTLSAGADAVINRNTLVAQGEFCQSEIAVSPQTSYCFGCYIDSNGEDVSIGVYGQLSHSSSDARDITMIEEIVHTDGFEKVDIKFVTPIGIRSCLVVFNGATVYKVTDIMIKAGEVFSEWTPHEGEVYASGIHISEERVRISTPNVDINILDPSNPNPENPLISMSASAGGFNRMITQAIDMGGYNLAQFSSSELAYYVNPNHANASDANDGKTEEAPFVTIMGALKKAGRIGNHSVTIYLASGSDYREKIRISGYQRPLKFDIYNGSVNPVIYGTGTQGVIVESCAWVAFDHIDFYCFFSDIPVYSDSPCNNAALSYRYSSGNIDHARFYCHMARYGAAVEAIASKVSMTNYIVNDFQHVMILHHLSSGVSKNGLGEAYENFIVKGAVLLASGNRPRCITGLYTALDAGYYFGETLEAYVDPLTNVQTPYEYVYDADFSGSWADEEIMTAQASNVRQGEDYLGITYTGVFGFNVSMMRTDLNGKTIKRVYLCLSRISDNNSIRDVHLWGCTKTAIEGEKPIADDSYDYGVISTFMGGDETISVGINPEIAEGLISEEVNTPNSLMIYDRWYNPLTILGYDQLDALKPQLRICV